MLGFKAVKVNGYSMNKSKVSDLRTNTELETRIAKGILGNNESLHFLRLAHGFLNGRMSDLLRESIAFESFYIFFCEHGQKSLERNRCWKANVLFNEVLTYNRKDPENPHVSYRKTKLASSLKRLLGEEGFKRIVPLLNPEYIIAPDLVPAWVIQCVIQAKKRVNSDQVGKSYASVLKKRVTKNEAGEEIDSRPDRQASLDEPNDEGDPLHIVGVAYDDEGRPSFSGGMPTAEIVKILDNKKRLAYNERRQRNRVGNSN